MGIAWGPIWGPMRIRLGPAGIIYASYRTLYGVLYETHVLLYGSYTNPIGPDRDPIRILSDPLGARRIFSAFFGFCDWFVSCLGVLCFLCDLFVVVCGFHWFSGIFYCFSMIITPSVIPKP